MYMTKDEEIRQRVREYAIELKIFPDEFVLDDLIYYNEQIVNNYQQLKENFEQYTKTLAENLAVNVYSNDYIDIETLKTMTIKQLAEIIQQDDAND